MNIYSKLSDWQKRGLITAEQQQKITDYENNVRRPMLYHALLFLSCFCIGIGVIAVIAANWEAFPPQLNSASILLSFVRLHGEYGTAAEREGTWPPRHC